MAKIDRAIKLMLTGGYDGTSMAQIAAACGLHLAPCLEPDAHA